MGQLTTNQLTALQTELNGDPRSLGYAPLLLPQVQDFVDLAVLLNFTRDGVTPCPANNVIGGPSGAVTGATNATPIVITSTAHGLLTGDGVLIAGVPGNTAANGTWVVTKINANTFSLTGSVGSGAYTSGGTFQWCVAGVRSQFVLAQTLMNSIAAGDVLTAGVATTITADQFGKLWLVEQLILAAQSNNGQIPLTNADGTDNNNVKSLRQVVTNPSTSRTAINALETRNGSRAEMLFASGVVLVALDIAAAGVGHY